MALAKRPGGIPALPKTADGKVRPGARVATWSGYWCVCGGSPRVAGQALQEDPRCVPGTRRRVSLRICGAANWEGAATAGITPCCEGAESWLCFPKGFSHVSSSPACPQGPSYPLASEACGGWGGARGGTPPPALCSGEAGPRQLIPVWCPRKQYLTQDQGPQGLSCVPTLTPETLCPFAIQKVSLRGSPVAGFQKQQPVFRMALSAAEQGWLEGWVC